MYSICNPNGSVPNISLVRIQCLLSKTNSPTVVSLISITNESNPSSPGTIRKFFRKLLEDFLSYTVRSGNVTS